MSMIDASTQVSVPPDMGGLAVAVGRLLEKQESMTNSLGRIEGALSGVVATQQEHSVELGVQKNRLDTFEKRLDDTKPVRVHWTAIAAIAIAILGACITVFKVLNP